MKNINKILIAWAFVISLSGCRKDLVYETEFEPETPKNGVSLDIDWELEWEYGVGYDWNSNWENVGADNDYDYFRPKKPEGIAVILYDGEMDGYNYNRELHLPASGGTISLDESTKAILLYNDDSDYIMLNNLSSPHTAYAATRTSDRSSRGSIEDFHSQERTMNAPDILYSAFKEFNEKDFNQEEKNKITLKPLVYGYVIRFYIPENREYISQARGAIAGLAESIYLKEGKSSVSKAVIPFDCTLTSYGAGVQVMTFGVPNDHNDGNNRYDINLELKFKNGKTMSFDFDITDQMEHQPTGGVIFLEDIKIPDALVKSGSGFETDVENWGDENVVDLPL